jgi:very-short-patch-repair endonuclease
MALIAGHQRGQISTGQLLAAGWSRQMIKTAVKHGLLRRIYQGVYTVGHEAHIEFGSETAAVLAVGEDAVLTGLTVLMAHKIVPHDPKRPIDVALITDRRPRQRPGIRLHRYSRLTQRDLRIVKGIPMTTVERALLDAAPELTARQLERAVDEAVALRLTSRTKVRDLMANTDVRKHGQKHLTALADARRPSSSTDSDPAELALLLIRQAGLPEPETEVQMYGFKADFFWSKAGVVLEVDGFRVHGLIRQNFVRDRRKDRTFRAHGLEVVRVATEELEDKPLAIIADLAMIIARRLAERAA